MTRTRLMLPALCAALWSVMAFSATGVQAEKAEWLPGKWLILTSSGIVKTGEELKAQAKSETDSAVLSLDSKILGIEIKVLCNGFQLIGVSLEGAGKFTEGGKASFTECTFDTNGKANASCAPKAGGGPVGTIILNEIKGGVGLYVLRNEKKEILAKYSVIKKEPKTLGGAFVTMEMGETCPVGEKIPINGVLYLKDSEGRLETHLIKHLFEEAKPPSEIWVTSTNNAEHKITLLGSVWILLAGAHGGLAWSGMPE